MLTVPTADIAQALAAALGSGYHSMTSDETNETVKAVLEALADDIATRCEAAARDQGKPFSRVAFLKVCGVDLADAA